MAKSKKLFPVIFSNPRQKIINDYLLYDSFDTSRSAGNINGTNAEPIGGTRTVTDTNGKISIAGGVLSFATGAAANDGVWYPIQTRVLGKVVIGKIIPSTTDRLIMFGWNSATSNIVRQGFYLNTIGQLTVQQDGSTNTIVGTYSATEYQMAVVLRASGLFYFIKGGSFTKWALLYVSTIINSNEYPNIGTNNAAFTSDNIRVPKRLFIPTPLQSDGFSAATTDGAGNAEANSPVGTTWTNRVGTVGRSSGKAIATGLVGGIAICTLPTGSPHVLHSILATRGTTGIGIILRYVDADNYVYISRVATNVKLVKRIAGNETTLIDTAATEVAGSKLQGIFDTSELRVFYNNAAVGTAATISDSGIANSGEMGLIFFDTDSTADNMEIWARGNEGQYGGLDAL